MKIKFHREEQWDLRDGAKTVLACHMKSSDGNRSTRLFAIVKLPRDCGYAAEWGGKWVAEFFREEWRMLTRRCDVSQQCTCDTIRAIGWCPVHRPPPTRDAERRAATLRAKLAEVERECTDARATLSHVNKALGYPVDVNKWDDAEAAGLMLVDAIRKSRERHDSAIEELRRVTLDRDAKKERADKADQARDAANAVNADMGSQMCRIRAALDSKPGTWRQMADSMLDVIDSLKAERDAAVRRAELLVGTFTSRNAIAKICGALGLASADTYEEDADAIIAAIDRLRDEAKAARKACPVDVSTLRLLRASGLFGNEIATLTARVEHYKRACITTSTEVTRVLGEALYGPNPDAWSTHTPEAIADEAAAEIATLRAENERMRGEIITYQDAHTTGTEIIDGLRAKVEALEANDDVIELIRVAIDPDEPRLSGSCRAMVDVWLGRVEAARVEGER